MQNYLTKNAPLDMDKWREIIDGWSESGESQKAYCQRLDVNWHTFSYARSKLSQQAKPKAQFMPLRVKYNEEEKESPPSTIVLENPHGFKMHVPTSLSLEQLAKLFKLSGWNDA